MKWDINSKTVEAVITSDIDQTVAITCGDNEQDVEFKAGESKTVSFNM